MGVIRLKNMQFYGFHGVSDSEKHLGGRFEVDVELHLSLKDSCESDDLNDTINYEGIYKTVDACIRKDKFYLIEALANFYNTPLPLTIDHFTKIEEEFRCSN